MDWIKRLTLKKGMVIIADSPKDNQCIVLGKVPDDQSVIYVFVDMDKFIHWKDKNGRKLPMEQQVPQNVKLPPEFLEQMKKIKQQTEDDKQTPKNIDEEREKRRRKLMEESGKGGHVAG